MRGELVAGDDLDCYVGIFHIYLMRLFNVGREDTLVAFYDHTDHDI